MRPARQHVISATRAVAPDLTMSVSPRTFDRLMARSAGEAMFQAPVVVVFILLAALLAGVGLFGVVAYLVEVRRREFGIRMALGARSVDVWRTVVRESVQPTCIGLVIGSLAATGLESAVQASVFGWTSSGPVALAAVVTALLLVAVIAALVPASRAMRIDPALTLRAE